MPNDNEAAWAASAQLASTAVGAYATASLNRRTRKWNEAQYQKQRADALKDWNMQNAYNSPAEQMKRLKAAGLNPNLIYGKGAGDMTSGAVRSSETPSWNPKAPDYSGAGDSLTKYMAVKTQDAQIDNLRSQNTVILLEQMLKAAQGTGQDLANQKSRIDLKYRDESNMLDNRLKDIHYDVAVNQIAQMMNKWDLDQEQLDIVRKTKPETIQMAVEKILSERVRRSKDSAEIDRINKSIDLLKNSTQLQRLELELKKQGMTWSDPLWQRLAAKILGEVQ